MFALYYQVQDLEKKLEKTVELMEKITVEMSTMVKEIKNLRSRVSVLILWVMLMDGR